MKRTLGVDPGSVHVGVSVWEGPRCIDAFELSPPAFAGMLNSLWVQQFDEVWAENYVPQGGFGNALTGTKTIKLLGYLEWKLRLEHEIELKLVTRLDRDASLKRLTSAGYPWAGAGISDHARDAEAVVIAGKKYRVADLMTNGAWTREL